MTPNQAAVFFRDHYDHWRTSEDREPEAINDDDNTEKEIDTMNTAKIYRNLDGEARTIHQMVREEQQWAANRIQVGEDAIDELKELKAACQGVKDPAKAIDLLRDAYKNWNKPTVEGEIAFDATMQRISKLFENNA